MRWRDIKKGKKPEAKKAKDTTPYAPIPSKIKAFLTDMFMIMMPLAYIVTYVIMNGKEDMQSSLIARNSLWIVYGIIMILFWSIKGQTPGYKAYNLKVIDAKTKQKPSFLKSLLRYIFFVISSTIIVGELIAFFRHDKKTLHDLLSGTYVIEIADTKNR